MVTSLQKQAAFQPRIDRLMDLAKDQAAQDSRTEPRVPLFQPVMLRRGTHYLSAFSRDISEAGIGLLHDMPIGGEYTITVQDTAGRQYDLTGAVLWCRPCGQGWYISGMRFCNIGAS
ncbi:MAG: PilZ domain-containing protein [Planctomycetales bacterium]|nr:PilZ domain-containing protein [Planctomycetales bacterium]